MAKKDSSKKEKKHYFKDFKAELKKVIWPTPKQLANNTITVIALVLITALIVFVLDFVFESMNTYGINKLKEAVNKNETAVVNEIEESSDENTNSVEAQNNATEETQTNAVAENNAE